MLKESKNLIENLDKHFLRKYKWRYHILVVDNHLLNCYSFFLQAHRQGDKVIHSYDLVEFKHDEKLFKQVLADMKKHTLLTVEYRDTHHLVHTGKTISVDLNHRHHR